MNPVIEITEFHLERRRGEEFVAALATVAPILKRQPGYVRHVSDGAAEDEDTFFLLVEWRDLTDHTEKFRNSADFDHFVQPLRRLLREPARVHHIRTNPPTASSEEDMTAADTRLATERLE